MTAWVLVCNPKRFRLQEMLDDGGELTSWSVGRHLREMREGDSFALWVSGSRSGVVATGQLTGEPFWTDEDDDDGYWAEAPGPRHVAPLRVGQWLEGPVPRTWFESQSAFVGATVLTQPFAPNPHRLTDQQWEALVIEAERTSRIGTSEVQLTADDDWDLQPGDEIRRVDLHTQYGGSRQGGISPSKTSNNVIFFTDPRTGEQHGYEDVWESEDHFRYTGEGQVGDQVFTRGNKAIRDYLRDGRHLRLFIGSRGVVRYVGEWILDPDRPYSWGRAPSTGGGGKRQVIHFHMIRVGAAVTAPDVPVGTEYRVEDESIVPAPAVPSAPDPALIGETLSKHRQLQNALAREVRDRGLKPLSPIPTDPAFDLAWRVGDTLKVTEVKSLRLENESHQLRTGLGQLLDYVDQLSARAPLVQGVLWVERAPSEDRWLGICERAGVVLAWPGTDMRIWQ
ncbi:EVE domain-containing protein [Streptomyces mirabilis]|uniref:EVE domain-containing protein n=1 Tax=Streptomyces mirabilis TaxID=68239 RepID=A0ABU3UR59_9ACTN|nr:EVE domain-containing protein [Streptomyces mirabilis]MDU8996421.1 EVE domain-containing protein [Streptomyces mirabilis]